MKRKLDLLELHSFYAKLIQILFSVCSISHGKKSNLEGENEPREDMQRVKIQCIMR